MAEKKTTQGLFKASPSVSGNGKVRPQTKGRVEHKRHKRLISKAAVISPDPFPH
jgi:hypothetical protein